MNDMKKRFNMRSAMLCVAVMALLAGCSSATGPMFSAWSVDRQDGKQTYRVDCHGLIEGAGTCYREAQEICHDQPVHPVEAQAPLGSTTSDGKPNTRTLIFQCGEQPQSIAAAPVAAPIAVPVPKHVTLAGDANFDFNKATLTAAAKERLGKLISDAKGMSFGKVTVTGYTDGVGSDSYNLNLSRARAQAVANYLQSHGLNADQFDIQGRGRANPVATNGTADGRSQNRRVEITLTKN
ncbi:OmpA family protein [Burkholderia cenocepacia]|uniref:OmpA family protein n=1 Tax=Burkholderia cepacia complex TaxID=87882 RepID=UPI002B2410B1|nr:OmpA family protein [Burkholderia cenocepacia]MEB2611323.1 OmpA family protein [Burkholderia cenocepacia]